MSAPFFDTIIVGAGISGLACATELQKYNHDFVGKKMKNLNYHMIHSQIENVVSFHHYDIFF